MLHTLLPLKTGEGKMLYTNDPMKAAVIMLSVCKEYNIKSSDYERIHLCTQLCLPNLKKVEFTEYWTDFSLDVSFLKK